MLLRNALTDEDAALAAYYPSLGGTGSADADLVGTPQPDQCVSVSLSFVAAATADLEYGHGSARNERHSGSWSR